MQQVKKIEFSPTDKQSECLTYLNDNISRYILFGGAKGGSKTRLGCYWIIINCLKYPGVRYLIGRSRLTTLTKSTLKTFLSIIKEWDLQGYVTHNLTSNTIFFKNGSEVLLVDLFPYPADPDFDRFSGYEVTGVFIDELSEIEEKAFNVLKSLIRYKLTEYNLIPKVLCATNPSKGWPYHLFYTPWKNNCLPKEYKFIQALPSDNPYLDKSYIQELEALTGSERERFLLGNWEYAQSDNELFDRNNLINCFYNDSSFLNTDNKFYITADIADLGSDRTIISIWQGWKLIYIDTYEKKDTEFIVNRIRSLIQTYKVRINNVIIDSVGVGAGVASYLKGCIRYAANNSALNNEKFVNIKAQLMNHLSDKINKNEVNFSLGYNDSIVKELIAYKKEVRNDKFSISNKDDVKRRLDGRSPDIADSIYLRSYFDFTANQGRLIVY